MKHLPTLFLATALLLGGTSACSKKEDPEPTPLPAKTGTYKLDSQSFTSAAVYSTAKFYNATTFLGDVITVYVYDGTTPDQATRSVELRYYKPEAKTDYTLESVIVVDKTVTPGTQRTYTDNLRATLTPTSQGYSGTFSASSAPYAPFPASSQLTEGRFTATARL